jgi:ParB family chromosome partitioning protein
MRKARPRKGAKAPAKKPIENIAKDLKGLVVDLSSLKIDPKNVNTHDRASIESLKYSLAEYGQQKPVVFNPTDRIITAGNGTVMAALELGWTKIAASGFDGPAEKVRRFAIVDNATPKLSRFDETLLRVELQQFDMPTLKTLGFPELHLHMNPSARTVGVDEAFSKLPSQERQPFQQVTFTLHDDQVAIIKAALERSKAKGPFEDGPNPNSNGNALARICESYRG